MSESQAAMHEPRFTLGVVIPVPEPQRSLLRDWRRVYGGAATAPIAPHITLISGSYLQSWDQAANQVRRVAQGSARFTVRLASVGSFRPASEVVYLPLSEGAEECWELHRALLADQLRHESQFEYHPHLTIAQNVPSADLDSAQEQLREADLSFEVRSLQLFDTRDGAWNLSEEIGLRG
ncbi:2'-5' RNA ligase family protein [Glutamicibacter arilaitensis]|uniref:2'-5' RNA ligase family protein n=1 Tax=Glutamicibacter arilaitensis TaxID=256701 RepID=UPI00384D1910